MGMSASQARLLSITARLTNNEFRAQTITNSKLRLASESEVASAKYMDALNSKQLMFMSYDDNGDANKVALTPAVLYEYSPLKNQYALRNPSGKVLVSNQDAKNFDETIDLLGFLQKYDLVGDVSGGVNINKKTEYDAKCKEIDKYNEQMQKNYNIQYENWQKKFDEYESAHSTWQSNHETWQARKDEYDAKYARWQQVSSKKLYDKFINTIGNSKDVLAKSDYNGPWACYKFAMEDADDVGCYLHLLNHILDYNGSGITERNYTTTTGTSFSTSNNGGGAMEVYNGYINMTTDQKNMMKEISDALNDTELNILCDGADTYIPSYNSSTGKDERSGNILQNALDNGHTPTELQKLRSDYKYNPETGKYDKIKTLKEKAIDLYYIIQEYSAGRKFTSELSNYNELKDMLINFTEGDLQCMEEAPAFNEPEPVEPIFTDPEPQKPEDLPYPEKPDELENAAFFIKDKDKAQWYVNLWFMMNGSDTANLVSKVDFENNSELYETLYKYVSAEDKAEYSFHVENCSKDDLKNNYEIFENNLYTSQTWLQFALEHGVVTIERAQYRDPSEDSGKIPQTYADAITWQSIAYKNAGDFVEVDDEKAIAIAEVKYKKTITEIENKDNKYDQDLKKLDTEHTALQTEYDSIKEVISKNVDRSFKAFS